MFRSRRFVVLTVAVFLVLTASAAVALPDYFWYGSGAIAQNKSAPAFEDVGGHWAETEIRWLGRTGVTRGCNPPANDRFCPDDPITRAQMAAFLHRYDDALGDRLAAHLPVLYPVSKTLLFEIDETPLVESACPVGLTAVSGSSMAEVVGREGEIQPARIVAQDIRRADGWTATAVAIDDIPEGARIRLQLEVLCSNPDYVGSARWTEGERGVGAGSDTNSHPFWGAVSD